MNVFYKMQMVSVLIYTVTILLPMCYCLTICFDWYKRLVTYKRICLKYKHLKDDVNNFVDINKKEHVSCSYANENTPNRSGMAREMLEVFPQRNTLGCST